MLCTACLLPLLTPSQSGQCLLESKITRMKKLKPGFDEEDSLSLEIQGRRRRFWGGGGGGEL